MASILPQPPNPSNNPNPNPTTTTTPSLPLPPTRALLTNLLNAISAIPLTPAQTTQSTQSGREERERGEERGNPLRRVPATHRHLIVTLHVLFPGLVLPALDLLERGFVARVVLAGSLFGSGSGSGSGGGVGTGIGTKTGAEGRGEGGGGDDASGKDGDDVAGCVEVGGGEVEEGSGGNAFYLVQSAAAVEAARERRRRRRYGDEGDEAEGVGGVGMGGHEKGYIVRLDAWHCTCAAFAFAAVQGEQDGEQRIGVGYGASTGPSGASAEAGTRVEWSFGGMSLDGIEAGAGEGVPVCKHLLACLLAEKWGAVLGQYAVERRVGREEMAGIVAEV